MDSLAKKIVDAIGKYHTKFMQQKVLKTIEEIEATTDPLEKYIAGAGSVDELNNKLMSRYAIVEGITPNKVGQFSTIEYPEGFTSSNCIVISIKVEGEGGYYFTNGGISANDGSNQPILIMTPIVGVNFKPDKIEIQTCTYSTSRRFLLVLMKISD